MEHIYLSRSIPRRAIKNTAQVKHVIVIPFASFPSVPLPLCSRPSLSPAPFSALSTDPLSSHVSTLGCFEIYWQSIKHDTCLENLGITCLWQRITSLCRNHARNETSMSNLLEDFTQALKLLVELLKVVSGLLRLPLVDTVCDSDLEVLGQSHEHVLQHLLAPEHTRLFVDHL